TGLTPFPYTTLFRSRRVVQRFFHGRVGEIEPVLEKVYAQHALQADGRPPVPRLRVHGLDACPELTPRHHAIHLGEELCPSRHLRSEEHTSELQSPCN